MCLTVGLRSYGPEQLPQSKSGVEASTNPENLILRLAGVWLLASCPGSLQPQEVM